MKNMTLGFFLIAMLLNIKAESQQYNFKMANSSGLNGITNLYDGTYSGIGWTGGQERYVEMKVITEQCALKGGTNSVSAQHRNGNTAFRQKMYVRFDLYFKKKKRGDFETYYYEGYFYNFQKYIEFHFGKAYTKESYKRKSILNLDEKVTLFVDGENLVLKDKVHFFRELNFINKRKFERNEIFDLIIKSIKSNCSTKGGMNVYKYIDVYDLKLYAIFNDDFSKITALLCDSKELRDVKTQYIEVEQLYRYDQKLENAIKNGSRNESVFQYYPEKLEYDIYLWKWGEPLQEKRRLHSIAMVRNDEQFGNLKREYTFPIFWSENYNVDKFKYSTPKPTINYKDVELGGWVILKKEKEYQIEQEKIRLRRWIKNNDKIIDLILEEGGSETVQIPINNKLLMNLHNGEFDPAVELDGKEYILDGSFSSRLVYMQIFYAYAKAYSDICGYSNRDNLVKVRTKYDIVETEGLVETSRSEGKINEYFIQAEYVDFFKDAEESIVTSPVAFIWGGRGKLIEDSYDSFYDLMNSNNCNSPEIKNIGLNAFLFAKISASHQTLSELR
ncbi:MAG: hypothetical protein KJN84_09775 [Bacteroidia bacterium]|nr:hypothetical protein [Bacteroidia bacterium]